VKPAVSYTWDWHPRLVPLGIWDETGLEIRNSSTVTDLYMDYQLSDDFKKCDITSLLKGKVQKGRNIAGPWLMKQDKMYSVRKERCRIILLSLGFHWIIQIYGGRTIMVSSVFIYLNIQVTGYRQNRIAKHEP
jgi:hypothetical protein